MNEIFIIAGDYLKGKSIYPSVRRLLNLLFNISIASFIYEKCYGNYNWFNYYDYKAILNFFVKGNFFIPLSIFIIVYGLTQFLAIGLFSVINHFKTVKLTREIIYHQIKKNTIDENLRKITEASKYVSPIRLTKNMMMQMYRQLSTHLTPEMYDQMEKELKEPKQNLEANFSLAFRALIAITIYFFSLPQFGWLLFTITSIILLIFMYIVMIAYRFLDILPVLIRRFQNDAEIYFKENIDKDKPSGEHK